MITADDKRTPSAAISTGRPVQAAHDGQMVHVKPTASYLQGSTHVGPHSDPYPIERHIAEELKANGFAKIVESPKVPEGDTPVDAGEGEGEDADEAENEEGEADEEGEGEGEQPDDTSRAPEQGQVTASTVPAVPGAEPQRPASPSPVPPAATTEPPRQRGRRGRGRNRQGA